MEATLNCDCGESYSVFSLGEDEGLLPLVDYANICCGVHSGDPDVMQKTVALALRNGVKSLGAHPGLPDRQGFGRRELKMTPESFFLCLLTQVGSLDAILKYNGAKYSHLKPHGQAYIMSSKDIELARQSAKIAKLYNLPLLGLKGSAHEVACQETDLKLELGVELIPEWYADLEYDDAGSLLPPTPGASFLLKTPEIVYAQTKLMLETRTWLSQSGKVVHSFPESQKKISICIHSDVKGAVATAMAVRRAIDDVKLARKA